MTDDADLLLLAEAQLAAETWRDLDGRCSITDCLRACVLGLGGWMESRSAVNPTRPPERRWRVCKLCEDHERAFVAYLRDHPGNAVLAAAVAFCRAARGRAGVASPPPGPRPQNASGSNHPPTQPTGTVSQASAPSERTR